MTKSYNSHKKAEELRVLELEFNKFLFEGVPLGSAMAYYWGRIFSNKLKYNLAKDIASVFYIYFKQLFKGVKVRDYQKPFFYYKTGRHRHYQKMEEAVVSSKSIRERAFVIGPLTSGDITNQSVLNNYSITDIFKAFCFWVRHFRYFTSLFKKYDLKKKSHAPLQIAIFRQLLAILSIRKFFLKQKSIKLVGGDYDRGSQTGPFFATASSLGIQTFTLQHGVINPPYGYVPLMADEIWVWGEMAKHQLLELGVAENQIKIVGNPNLENFFGNTIKKNDLLKKYSLPDGKNIVLAINPIKSGSNKTLVGFLGSIKEKYPNHNYYVKLHPAQRTESFSWIKEEFDVGILPNPFPLEQFIPFVDILLTYNSGIAAECFYYGIPVGITDVLPELSGNGLELHKHLKVPLLKSPRDFELKILNAEIKQDQKTKIFFAVGEESKNFISQAIQSKLERSL